MRIMGGRRGRKEREEGEGERKGGEGKVRKELGGETT